MSAVDWDRLAAALDYPAGATAALQEEYVRTFDFDPDCSLEIGWHLYGERPERGSFLAALRADLAAAGVAENGNLPDYLPTLLRLIGKGDATAGSALAATIAPAVAQLRDRVQARQNPFSEPLEAVVRALDAPRQEERP